MSESHKTQRAESAESAETEAENPQRREALRRLGKWSGASVLAALGAAAWISTPTRAQAGWLNRRVRGGGWVNGGGGGWVNRRGGGGWINRR